MLEEIMRHLLVHGFVAPSASIYGGLKGFYDYGPMGALLKRNIERAWLEEFVLREDNVFLVDGSLILPFQVLKASGHVDHFTDPTTKCGKCGRVFRADKLVEERLGIRAEGMGVEELGKAIKRVRCPTCGGDLSGINLVNLMFEVGVGPYRSDRAYLRPETAQVMFLDFRYFQTSLGLRLPFGIAQVGKSFRNEISPRQGLLRLREFTQMEVEMFIDPSDVRCPGFEEVKDVNLRILTRDRQVKGATDALEISAGKALSSGLLPNEYMAYYLAKETLFFTERLGISTENVRFRHLMPEETPHYSGGNFDLEVRLSVGWIEVVGNAYRRDYDLKQHMEHSGKDLSMTVNGRKVIPHVVEPSFGLDRMIYCLLEHSYTKEGRKWPWLRLPTELAPIRAAVLPLSRRPLMVKVARDVHRMLRRRAIPSVYLEKGSIGSRYARSDMMGIPYCITIDYGSLNDSTVTLRNRDTREQRRIKISDIPKELTTT